MKNSVYKALLLLIPLFSSIYCFANNENDRALIYSGKFASGAYDFQDALAAHGYDVDYFENPSSLIKELDSAALVIFPGTNDDAGTLGEFINEFSQETLVSIDRFVRRGGRFLGVCGGAYIASTAYETAFESGKGLGLAPVFSHGYLDNEHATIIDVQWKHKNRTIYYQLGQALTIEDGVNYKIISTYRDGTIAGAIIRIEKGGYYLIGPHPEVLIENLEPSDIKDGSLTRLTDTSDLLDDVIHDLSQW